MGKRAIIQSVLQQKLVERHARCNDMAVEGAMQPLAEIQHYRLEAFGSAELTRAASSDVATSRFLQPKTHIVYGR